MFRSWATHSPQAAQTFHSDVGGPGQGWVLGIAQQALLEAAENGKDQERCSLITLEVSPVPWFPCGLTQMVEEQAPRKCLLFFPWI